MEGPALDGQMVVSPRARVDVFWKRVVRAEEVRLAPLGCGFKIVR